MRDQAKGCMVLFKPDITPNQIAAIYAGLQTVEGVQSVTPSTAAHALIDTVKTKAEAINRIVDFAAKELAK